MVLFLDALMGYVVEKSDSLATTLYNRVWCSLTYKIGGLLGLACAVLEGRGVSFGLAALGKSKLQS